MPQIAILNLVFIIAALAFGFSLGNLLIRIVPAILRARRYLTKWRNL